MEVGEQRVRIVGGEFRGRRITAPVGEHTRPTTDRVREALMSALSSRLDGFEGQRVLDVFAGSGALGLEALSRGAETVTFVERDRRALEALRANVAALGIANRVRVVADDAFSLAKRGVSGPFTLILIDPPYKLVPVEIGSFLHDLADSGSVAAGATISLEHPSAVPVRWPDEYEPVASKRYGSVGIDMAFYPGGEGSR